MHFIYIITPGPTASINPTGNNIAGERYSLVCSVTAPSQPTIIWLDNGGMAISSDSSRTVSATTGDSSNGYSSTLTFNPLSASHAGNYTCRAIVDGEMVMDTEMVTVQSEYQPDVVQFLPSYSALTMLFISRPTHLCQS